MTDGNVTDINARGKKKKKSSDNDAGEAKKSEIFESVKNSIDNPFFNFPLKLHKTIVDVGVVLPLLELANGEVRLSNLKEVAGAILNYYAGDRLANITWRTALEAADYWIARGPHIPMPPCYRWPGDEGLAFRCMPWAPAAGEMPTWQSLLDGITEDNAKAALMAWIGSLFVPESYNQQYIWIYGQGGNGKGSLLRFLHKIFGNSSHVISNVQDKPNQFWTMQMANRRLVMFPDCENARFVASGLFKSMSGGDPINVEPKGGMPYSITLEAKYIFTSQLMPELSSENSDKRRAILVEMDKANRPDPTFENRLWNEGGAFLHKCLESYNHICSNHAPIPAENLALHDWVASIEEPLELFFREWFVLDKDCYLLPEEFGEILDIKWEGKKKQRDDFRAWLKRTHGISRKNTWIAGGDGAQQHRYRGIRRTKDPAQVRKERSRAQVVILRDDPI